MFAIAALYFLAFACHPDHMTANERFTWGLLYSLLMIKWLVVTYNKSPLPACPKNFHTHLCCCFVL